MATEAALEPSTCGEKRKEVMVSFMTTDSPHDASEMTKLPPWRTASMSLPFEKVLCFLDCEEKIEFMTVKPLEISKILEPEKKYLCLKYGPKKKPMFIHLDFTDESRENFDEWNDFLRRMMGLESSPQRMNTENARTLQKRKPAPQQRIKSSFQLSIPVILGPVNSGEAPNSPDGVLEPPSSSTDSGSESPEISDGDSTSDMSSFGNLESTYSKTDIIYDCPKDLLNQHQFKEYQDEIVVTQSVPDSKLNPGDTIALRTGEESATPMNIEELREYIRKTEAPTIELAVTPGVEITMKDGDQKLTINITGQKTQRPDAVEAVLKACNPRLAIADINGTPIPVGTQADEISEPMNDESLISKELSSLGRFKSTGMSDVVANRAELPMAILKSFYSQDDVDTAYSSDDFEKYKRENCCELRGGRLNFYERGEPDHNTTATVVKVEKRRGTNILILRCGPGGRMVIFLEFNSKRVTDEWQEALCRCTGQPYDPNPALPRIRSELLLPAVVRRRRDKQIRSNFPDIVVEQVDSDSEQEAPLEAPEEAPLEAPQEAPEAPQEAPLEAHRDAPPVVPPEGPSAPPARLIARPFASGTIETDPRPGSLRSRDADLSPNFADLANNSVEKEFNLSDLQQLKVKDCGGDVIVKKANPLCQLHVGDTVLLRNACGFPMNARELTEHIRTSINLTIVRSAVCTPREEEHELAINIKGSQIAKNMREALESSREDLTFHRVPQSLLDYQAV